MPGTIVELFDRSPFTTGLNPGGELRYLIAGETSENAARTLVYNTSPALYSPFEHGLLLYPRHDVSVEQTGVDSWIGAATYGGASAPAAPVSPVVQEPELSGDISVGQQHVTQALQHISSHTRPFNPALLTPDHKGSIGVTKDGVDGVDIMVPVHTWQETWYFQDSWVTANYRHSVLPGLVRHVNSAPFRGYPIGEVIFLGAGYSKRRSSDWQFSYKFAQDKNLTDIGSANGWTTPINKLGWEYLWFEYAHQAGTPETTLEPRFAHVERMYDYGDFSLFGIGMA